MSLRTKGLRSARIITAGLIAGSSALTAIGSVGLWDSTQVSTTEDTPNISGADTSPLAPSEGGVTHARSTGS